ncbi:PorT family protein [Algoriphagus lacus]|uniref:PorT family protein n=1 Tax=Algoriphagus lacus TaxID=2056311 RepID=A0A418PPF5_9BACT|nr:porin family protein [Algoriphagus lacus]RIW13969.1 PorT family protein [Algoriphagus lacus]
MRKIIVLLFLSFFALESYSQGFSFGPKIGVSSTTLKFDNDEIEGGDNQTGYHIGAFARFGGAGLFIQPEVLFTQTSGDFKYNGFNPGGDPDFEADFNRLDIPVMVGFRMFKILRLQAGPIASINLKTDISNAGDDIQDVDTNSATFGYQAGLGIDIGNLFIDAKYEGGLSGVVESIGGYSTDQRLNQWVLSLGFKLF